MDKEERARQINSLITMPGFKHIDDYIRDRMTNIRQELATNEFESIEGVIRLQGEYKALESILSKIKKWTKGN